MAAFLREIDIEVAKAQRTKATIYAWPAEANGPRRRAPAAGPATLILAHGAGAPQRSPFITGFARGLSERGLDVVTFDFLYMHHRRRAPDRMPQLIACYRAVIDAAREQLVSAHERLLIGGKSMGGRVATHVAADDPALSISGIVLLGYPLHPPGRPDQRRDAHLPNVKRPMLFVQGSRDTFGTPAELKPILDKLRPIPTVRTVDGGDHSFKLDSATYDIIQDAIVEWIGSA